MKSKVVIIGIDGATLDIVRPMAERGLLPHMAGLMQNGIHGELRSTIHPITPHAWSTFLTGKNAGKHGIYDFTNRKDGSYDVEFVNASRRTSESMFLYLSRQGLRVGAIAVPFTFPPEPVNGFMLSGFDAPAEDERAVYPPGLFEDIKRRFSHYHIHLASPVGRKNDVRKFWNDIRTEDKNRTDISLYLMEQKPCDLFMTMFVNTDRVQHQYLTFEFLEALKNGQEEKIKDNLIFKTYRNTDREIGRILDVLDEDTTVILMSDHGSGPIRRIFLLNRWLEQHGYLAYRNSTGRGVALLDRVRSFAKRVLPRWAKGLLKGIFSEVRDKVESYRFFSEIDWARTRAYGFGLYGNIFINLRGREPQGVVPQEDCETLCGELRRDLLSLKDPDTGELLIEHVWGKQDLYHGPSVDRAPDLVLQWRDYAYYTSTGAGRERGSSFGTTGKIDSSDFDHVGTHRLNGLFIARGRHLRRQTTVYDAHIADIAPTVLFALGQPIPDDLDGTVLRSIFTEDFLSGHVPTYRSSDPGAPAAVQKVAYTDEEARKVQERLKGLGYL